MGSGGRGVRPVYEDLSPKFEWKEDEQSQILFAYLPLDFMKDQIKISTEGMNTLRVTGERFVGGNKWSRFKEDFNIPEDCNMRAIRAKFEPATGTLTITMPKKSQVDPKAKPISKSEEATKTTTLESPLRPQRDTMDKQPRYGKIQEDTTDRFTSDPKRRSEVDDKITTTTTTTVQSPRPQETSARVPLPGQAQKDYIDTPRPKMIANSESEYEYGKRGSKEPTPQKGGVAAAAATPDPKETSSTSGTAVGVEKQQDRKERAIGSKTSAPKHIVQEEGINARKESEPKGRPKMTEIVMEKPIIMQTKEKDSSSLKYKPENVVMKKAGKKEKDSTIEGTVDAQKEEKAKDYSYFAKVKQITDASSSGGSGGGGGDGFELEKYKQAVQRVVGKGGLSLNEEERQLVVNVGAALLVIMALGVYIYYN
ncbi:Protein RESTRICTED TEV MOVEMENT 2 [Camellia lanceoleosa]|uniref:Protein RESTRICTED TEV MOVEMENT 2 n=1 Tax=Camellia lanceoleosa TaxID=1840588 RepID=A0ACC0IFH3_9ERIC|nr:Protein RESTRICTED TEV MOVEMENT 2 [Camellia lanceoleosa]